MPLWRRDEPLHERLAREGGMLPPPHDPGPHWGEVGIHGVARPRRWDAVATAEAAELSGDELRFVALPDRTILIEEGDGDADPSALAAAIESSLEPPYRADAVRRGETTWAVAARKIEVAAIDEDPGGDRVEVVVNGDERSSLVDGAPAFGTLRAFEVLGAGRFEAYVVHGERLDGDLWEVRVAPL